MATIPAKPFLMQNAVLKIEDDDFAAACSAIALVPTSSAVIFNGLKRNSSTFPTVATWVCTITYSQDWETAAALAQYLHDNEGLKKEAQIIPNADEDDEAIGKGFDVVLVIAPGQIGGTVNQVASSTVSLGVDGKPSYIVPTP